MNAPKKIVLKFGGSALTKKEKTQKFPTKIEEIIQRSDEFIEQDNFKRLIGTASSRACDPVLETVILNGAGPFGHYLVNEYKEGNKTITPALVHQSVEHLNFKVTSKLRKCGREAVSVHPYNTCFCKDDKYNITELWKIMKAYLDRGITPTSYGDVVPTVGCKGKHFENYQVISGDDLAVSIADYWKADKIVMVPDVDGVYTRNPKYSKNAKLVPRIVASEKFETIEEFVEEMKSRYNIEFREGKGKDVTKGFPGKVFKLYNATYETGITSQICGADALEHALLGKDNWRMFSGTIIKRK